MSLSALFAARYGPTIIKALLSYYKVSGKELYDLPLKMLETQLKDEVDAFKKSDLCRRLSAEAETDLAKLKGPEVDEETFRRAVDIAAVTLENVRLYPILFDHIFHPEKATRKILEAGAQHLDSSDSPVGAMHQRVVERTLSNFVSHIHELPGFQSWFIREVRRRFEAGDTRLDALERLVNAQLAEEVRFELDYLRTLLTELDVVQLFIKDVPFTGADVKQKLEAAYVKLQLGSSVDRDKAAFSVPADDLLMRASERTRRIVILGNAGNGKTTLLRWYGLQAARRRLPRKGIKRGNENLHQEDLEHFRPLVVSFLEDSWRDRVPFFIQLRHLQEGTFPSPSDFFCSVKPARDVPPGWAQKIVDQGRALLLIDGLDELSPLQREKALHWIEKKLTSYHRQNLIVVSSRPQAVDPGSLAKADFEEYEIHELGHDARIECATAWHRAVAIELTGKDELSNELQEKRDRIIRLLESDGPIPKLASNPLFCALLCALNRLSEADLPSTLGKLCDLIVQMLLNDRDEKQELSDRIVPRAYAQCNYRQRHATLRRLAEHYLEQERYALPREDVHDSIAMSLHKILPDDVGEVEDVLRGLIERSSLLRDHQQTEVEFAHNSVRDHLASLNLRSTSIEKLVKRVRGPNRAIWEPVLLFAGMKESQEEFAQELIKALLTPLAEVRLPLKDDVRLASELAAATGMPLPPDLRLELDRAIFALIGGGFDWEMTIPSIQTADQVDLIAMRGHDALPLLRPVPGRSEEVQVASVRALAALQSKEAHAALLGYLTKGATDSVLEAVAEAIGLEEFSQHREPAALPSVQKLITQPNGGVNSAASYIRSIPNLRDPEKIESLWLAYTMVRDISPVRNMTSLRILDLSSTPVVDLAPLNGLVNLQQLSLSGALEVDLSTVHNLPNLNQLWLNSTLVDDLSTLRNFPSLEVVDLGNMPLKDLSPLADLPSLRLIHLEGSPVVDLTPLHVLKHLKTLHARKTKVTSAQVAALKKAVPGCQVLWDEPTPPVPPRKMPPPQRGYTDEEMAAGFFI